MHKNDISTGPTGATSLLAVSESAVEKAAVTFLVS
jgi:hypothetical protein